MKPSLRSFSKSQLRHATSLVCVLNLVKEIKLKKNNSYLRLRFNHKGMEDIFMAFFVTSYFLLL